MMALFVCVYYYLRAYLYYLLINDPDFTLNRGECGHHKLGLLVAKIQKACHNIMVEILGADADASIGEFKTSNMLDMFQRQLTTCASL